MKISRKINQTCPVCGIIFEKYPSSSKRFCTKKCMGVGLTGANNPNYGNKWTLEKRILQSNLVKSKVDKEYREKVGKANRGKKFSEERIRSMHAHRDKSSYSHPHTEENKKKIGQKSKEKFTPEFKQNLRKKMIERGHWIDDCQKTDFQIYQKLSQWKERMWEYASEKEVRLLRETGVFNTYTNQTGCVRDHKLSKRDGFVCGVFPEILRHPANLAIIGHYENSSKNKSSSITLQQLFSDIETFQYQWDEHDLVLSLIKKYKDGERFNVSDYKGR